MNKKKQHDLYNEANPNQQVESAIGIQEVAHMVTDNSIDTPKAKKTVDHYDPTVSYKNKKNSVRRHPRFYLAR